MGGDVAVGGQPLCTGHGPARRHGRCGKLQTRTPITETWLSGLEFCYGPVLLFFFLQGIFAKCTPTFSSSFCLLPPPTSEVFGSWLVGLVPFPALTQGKRPQRRSPRPQGSQEKVAGKILGK